MDFYRFWLDYTWFYRDFLDFFRCKWVLTRFWLGFLWFQWVYWVLLGFFRFLWCFFKQRFDIILPGFTGCYWVFTTAALRVSAPLLVDRLRRSFFACLNKKKQLGKLGKRRRPSLRADLQAVGLVLARPAPRRGLHHRRQVGPLSSSISLSSTQQKLKSKSKTKPTKQGRRRKSSRPATSGRNPSASQLIGRRWGTERPMKSWPLRPFRGLLFVGRFLQGFFFTEFYRVSWLDSGLVWPLTGLLPSFLNYYLGYRVLLGFWCFTGFYLILMDSIELYWFWSRFTGFP